LFDPNFQQSSSNKESPCKLIFTPGRSSSHLEDICSIKVFFTVLDVAHLALNTTCRLLLLFTVFAGTSYVKQNFATNLESPTSFTWTFTAPWESNRLYSSSNKESGPLCNPIFLTPPSEKIIFSIEVTPLHYIGDNTSYMKHMEHDHLSQELNLYRSNLTGAHCTFRSALRESNITHTNDFVRSWL